MKKRIGFFMVLALIISVLGARQTVYASPACDLDCHGDGGGGSGGGGGGEEPGYPGDDGEGGEEGGGETGGGGGEPCESLSCMTDEEVLDLLYENSCTGNDDEITIDAYWKQSPGVCMDGTLTVNACTGQLISSDGSEVECLEKWEDPGEDGDTKGKKWYDDLCKGYDITPSSFTCITDFNLEATAGFPAVEIHARPYPATLVRYDTKVRFGAFPSSSGSNFAPFISWAGGSEDDPRPGDWRNVTLTITLYPKQLSGVPKFGEIYLEHIGWIKLAEMEMYTFQWPLPSHPAGGGGPTAGEVGQLQELPQDFPLLENYVRTPYGARCELTYQEWGRLPGWEEPGWINMTDVVEITPDMVPGYVGGYDTDGNGSLDAFTNGGVVVRRMNDADSVDDPVYGHSYSWLNGIFYWAVREAQGQISFP